MYFVGIDIAKRFHEAAAIDEQGKIIIKRIKFQNSHAGYCKLMEAVRKLNQPVEFAMEATEHYRFSLYAHLCQDNHTLTFHSQSAFKFFVSYHRQNIFSIIAPLTNLILEQFSKKLTIITSRKPPKTI